MDTKGQTLKIQPNWLYLLQEFYKLYRHLPAAAVSENHQGVYMPGSMIFNPPEHLHRITVSDREPALLAYAWLGQATDLEDQKMVCTRSHK